MVELMRRREGGDAIERGMMMERNSRGGEVHYLRT
jgi:hypothetical protein